MSKGKAISGQPPTRETGFLSRGHSPAQSSSALKSSASRHVVNSRKFQIGYRIDDLGSAVVEGVDLYVTQDGGRTWFKYGEDADLRSPFPVHVPADGVYGFDLRVRSDGGSAASPPQQGDKPSIVVTVDQTPPVAQLFQVQPGTDKPSSDILIRWVVRDDHLGETPIALSYASSPAGPWRQIGDWQANSGLFAWSPDPDVPAEMFLRLTARDEAGNTTEIAAPDAVVMKRPNRSVRIMGIEPQGPDQKPF